MAAQPDVHQYENAKKVLTYIGLSLVDNYAHLMKAVVDYSVHPTPDDAIAELSRSELIFVALLEAMSLRQLEMSSNLLRLIDEFRVFPRITKSFGGKLAAEFNVPSIMLTKAWDYAKELQASGLLEVPEMLLNFVDHLRKCTEKDEKAAAANSQQGEGAYGIDKVQAGAPKERRRRKRRRSPQDRQEPQEAEMIDVRDVAIGPDLPAPVASSLPPPQVVRSAEEVRVATDVLWSAVEAGDAARARTALGWGADVASRREVYRVSDSLSLHGVTPLHIAAWKGHSPVMEVLLAAGADLETRTDIGSTPLRLAALQGREETVRRLMEAGAQIEAENRAGCTALRGAAYNGHLGTVRLLVLAGANVNSRNNTGCTPLRLAAQQGREEVVQRLLEAGAQIEAANNSGWTALSRAACYGHLGTVRLLVQAGANVNRADNEGRTPLGWAQRNGHHPTADYLRSVGGTE